MKRFLVFTYDDNFTCGGIKDLYGDFETFDEANKALRDYMYDYDLQGDVYEYGHIFDIENMTMHNGEITQTWNGEEWINQ
jgi:hypothetical protein